MKHDTILRDEVKNGIKLFIVLFIISFIIVAFFQFYSMSVYEVIKNTLDAVSSYLISKLGEKMYKTIGISLIFAIPFTLLLHGEESDDIEDDDDESDEIEDEDYLEVPEEFIGRESEYWKRYYKAFPELCED